MIVFLFADSFYSSFAKLCLQLKIKKMVMTSAEMNQKYMKFFIDRGDTGQSSLGKTQQTIEPLQEDPNDQTNISDNEEEPPAQINFNDIILAKLNRIEANQVEMKIRLDRMEASIERLAQQNNKDRNQTELQEAAAELNNEQVKIFSLF